MWMPWLLLKADLQFHYSGDALWRVDHSGPKLNSRLLNCQYRGHWRIAPRKHDDQVNSQSCPCLSFCTARTKEECLNSCDSERNAFAELPAEMVRGSNPTVSHRNRLNVAESCSSAVKDALHHVQIKILG